MRCVQSYLYITRKNNRGERQSRVAPPANKPFRPSKFYTPSTNAASFSRAFSAPVAYITRATLPADACICIHTRTSHQRAHTWSSGRERFRGLVRNNILSRLIYVSRMRKGSDRTVQCAQSCAGGRKAGGLRLHVACSRTNNLRNLISFCVSHVGRDARDARKNIEATRKKIA